jgi:hypothetical protein
MTNYEQIVKAAGAEFVRQTPDNTVYFRNDAGVELSIIGEVCDVANVKLRLEMTRRFPPSRRDDLSEAIRVLKGQIANRWHQLACHRHWAQEKNLPPHVTAEEAERQRNQNALLAIQDLGELDILKIDLADREREWLKLAPSFRELTEIELRVAEAKHDLKYFEEIVEGLQKQLRALQVVSVTSEAIG